MNPPPVTGQRAPQRALALALAFAGLGALCLVAFFVGRALAGRTGGEASASPGPSEPPSRAILLAGGDAEHPFARDLDRGTRAAARELGIAIETVWSDWELPRIVADFEAAIAQGPDMILTVGHAGEAAMSAPTKRALEAGIAVVVINVELPTLQARHVADGLAYVGAINSDAGARLARACVRRGRVPAGSQAVVFATGVGRESARGDRARGAAAALRESGLQVSEELLPRALDLAGDQGLAQPQDSPLRTWLALMEDRHGDDRVWIFDSAPAAIGWADLVAAGELPKPDDRIVGTLDLDPPALLTHLAAGRLDVIWNQQPFMQGYYALVQAHLNHELATAGSIIDTAASGVTREDLPLPQARRSSLSGHAVRSER